MKNLSRPRIRTLLAVLAMACACAVALLGQTRGSFAIDPPPPLPTGDWATPGGEPIPPTPTPFSYGPKGIGDDWHLWATPNPGTNLDALDFDWYYDWRVNFLPERGSDPRYVRMVYCNSTSGIVAAASEDYNNNRRGRVWLVYNEPDHSGPSTCGITLVGDPAEHMYENPEWAASHFSDVYDLIKGADPSARVFVGGLAFLDSQRTRNWWQDFINTLQSEGNLHKLEGVHIHVYPLVSHSTNPPQADASCHNAVDGYCVPDAAQAANNWYNQMHVGLGLGNRPIWITEMGWLGCTLEGSRAWARDNIMEPMSQWFAGDLAWPHDPQVALNPGYETVAWYVTRDTNVYPCSYLLDSIGPGGTPTELGQFWNGYQP